MWSWVRNNGRVAADSPLTGGVMAAALLVFGFCLLTFPGHLPLRDSIVRYDVAQSIQQGLLHVDASFGANQPHLDVWYVTGQDGHRYSRYPLLHSLLMLIPMLAFDSQRGAALAFVLLAPLVPLLGMRLGLACGFDQRRALASACLLTFATMMLPYARDSHDNFLIALGTLGCLAALAGRTQTVGQAALAGLFFGLLVNVKMWAVAALPMIAWLIPYREPGSGVKDAVTAFVRGLSQPMTWKRALAFALTAAPLIFAYFAYVNLRFGSPMGDIAFEARSTPRPFVALAGLTVGPAKSIFLYNPILLAAPWALFRLTRRNPRMGIAIFLGVAGSFAMTCMYGNWHGDIAWGPRYILPAIALLAITVPELANVFTTRLERWVAYAVIVGSVAIQIVGSSIYPARYFFETGHSDFQYVNDRTYQYYFTLEPSQFSSALLAVPEVVRVSVDMALHDGEAVAREVELLRRVDTRGLAPEVRDHVASRLRLLGEPGYSTLSWWWIFDAVAPTAVAWSTALTRFMLALAALCMLAGAAGLQRAFRAAPHQDRGSGTDK